MRRLLSVCVALGLVACTSTTEGPDGGATDARADAASPDAGATDAGASDAEGTDAEATDASDEAILADGLDREGRRFARERSATDGRSAELMTRVKPVLHVLIEDDPTLDLSLDAAGNAAAIRDRVAAETAGCAQVDLTLDSRTATVRVVVDGACTTSSSVTFSGEIVASVTVFPGSPGGPRPDGGPRDGATDGGTTEIAVALTLDVEVDGEAFAGTVQVSTRDLVTYDLSADLSLDGVGQATFVGHAALGLTAGAPPVVTVDGSGSLTPASPGDPLTVDGWTCTPQAGGIPYTLVGLRRTVGACAAEAGRAEIVRRYDCTKRVLIPRRDAQVQSSTGVVTLAGEWSAATATSGEIAVTVTTELGGALKTTGPTAVPIRTCP